MTQQVPPLPPPPGRALNYAPPVRNDLYEIARRQRGIMKCIVGYIVCWVCVVAVPRPVNGLFALASIAVAIGAMVYVFMLAVRVYNTAVGILLGIVTLVPLIGLLALVSVNGKATKILRENGIKVGLMGADIRQVPQAGTY